jgi:hypothetical protein
MIHTGTIPFDLQDRVDGGRQTTNLGFLNFRDPKTVEEMLRELAASATKTRG